MHGSEGMCGGEGMDSRGHAWQGDISWQERWPQQRTVRILLGCARFAEILSELTKTWSSGATEYRV